MKPKITEDIKEIISQSINWGKLEVNYLKLTASEKLIVLMSAMIIGAVILLLLLPFFIMMLFALVGTFMLFMAPPLAYLAVGGIVLMLNIIVFLLRKPLVINPISRFITKVILDKQTDKKQTDL